MALIGLLGAAAYTYPPTFPISPGRFHVFCSYFCWHFQFLYLISIWQCDKRTYGIYALSNIDHDNKMWNLSISIRLWKLLIFPPSLSLYTNLKLAPALFLPSNIFRNKLESDFLILTFQALMVQHPQDNFILFSSGKKKHLLSPASEILIESFLLAICNWFL